MRLIDADEVFRFMESRMDMQELYLPVHFMDIVINEIPTIEAEPIRHGRWIPIDGEPYAKCSYCGEKHYGCTTPYCDMCGARMDGDSP